MGNYKIVNSHIGLSSELSFNAFNRNGYHDPGMLKLSDKFTTTCVVDIPMGRLSHIGDETK